MIALIQKMLQLYAAKALHKPGEPATPVDQVIAADEDKWEPLIQQLIQSDQITHADFSQDLQKRMEGTLLGQTSGSYTQRVQVMRYAQASVPPHSAATCCEINQLLVHPQTMI